MTSSFTVAILYARCPCCFLQTAMKGSVHSRWLFRVEQCLRWHQLKHWLHFTDGMLLVILLLNTEHNSIWGPGFSSTPSNKFMRWNGVTIFGWRFVVFHVVSVSRSNRRRNHMFSSIATSCGSPPFLVFDFPTVVSETKVASLWPVN